MQSEAQTHNLQLASQTTLPTKQPEQGTLSFSHVTHMCDCQIANTENNKNGTENLFHTQMYAVNNDPEQLHLPSAVFLLRKKI